MNIEDTVNSFIESIEDEHNSTYFSGEYYTPSRDRTVDFFRVDYETYDEDEKTSEEIKEDIRSLILRDIPELISRVTNDSPIINIDLFHGVLFKRYIKGKKATSYTIYIAIAVEW